MLAKNEYKNSSKRKLIILAIIIIAISVAMFVLIPGIITKQNYEKGIEAIYSGDYDAAIGYLEKSKAEDAAELIESIKHNKEALANYESHDYENAIIESELVMNSYPNYKEVMEIHKKSIDKLTEQILEDAKKLFAQKEYIAAYDELKKVLRYDPTHKEASKLIDIYKEEAKVMEAQIEENGYFLVDSSSIKQREMVNIDEWNAAGYTGKGLTIFHDDTGNSMHSLNCADILKTILPDAIVLRGIISGTTDKDGVTDAYITCYTTDEISVPFDEFILKHNVSLINNSTTGGRGDIDSKWSVWMREKLKQYNIIGCGAAGNMGQVANRFYGAFIMVSGVYLNGDNSITDYGVTGDVDFSMFMGYQSGTSYASPFLCGMAGLLRSRGPDITQEEVYQYFKEHSNDLGEPGKDPEYGWGLPIMGNPEE